MHFIYQILTFIEKGIHLIVRQIGIFQLSVDGINQRLIILAGLQRLKCLLLHLHLLDMVFRKLIDIGIFAKLLA